MTLTQRRCCFVVLGGLALCPAEAQTNALSWNVKQAGAVADGHAEWIPRKKWNYRYILSEDHPSPNQTVAPCY